MDNFSFLTIFSLPFVFKIFLLVVMGGVSLFTLVVLNQVRVMNNIVHFGFFSKILLFIAFLFVLAAISLFFFSLVIL